MKKIIFCFLLLSVFSSCKETPTHLQRITAETTVIDSVVIPNPKVVSFIDPYKAKLEDEVHTVITYAANDLSKNDGELQSSMGNIMADIIYEKATLILNNKTGQTVDFAMSNHGGIRTTIFKGDITVEHVYKLMPFENRIVIAELSYENVVALFDYFIKEQRAHPVSKQVQIHIQNNQPQIQINGKPLEKDKTYFVATSDYLQKGGDGMNFFKNPESLLDTNYLIREAIMDDFKQKDTLFAVLDNRILIN